MPFTIYKANISITKKMVSIIGLTLNNKILKRDLNITKRVFKKAVTATSTMEEERKQ